ncbi:MAG: hypothetical protein ACKVOQ_06095 [Cyclobacteriaceae bacterium]
MKAVIVLRLWIVTICIATVFLSSCVPQCGCGNPPPHEYWYIHTYYKTNKGASLLNSNTPDYFKPSEISVKTIVLVNEIETEEYYGNDKNGVRVQENGDQQGNTLLLNLPVKYGNRKPIMTLIRLRPNLTDTVTYSFNNRLIELDREIPDLIYYNQKLIWDFSKAVAGEFMPNSITIIK